MSDAASPASPVASSPPGSGSRSQRNRKRKGGKGAAAAAAAAAAPQQQQRGHQGHQHGGGHSHSHGGAPCHGHGGPEPSFSDVDPDSLSEAVHYCDVCWHYQSYRQHSFARLERMQSDFQIVPTALQSLVPDFDLRMQSLRQAVVANFTFIQEILSHRYVFHNSPEIDYDVLEEKVAREHPVDEERMGRVRSTLRQCVRDWSAEGAAERAACYGPILDELERIYPTMESREGVRVLVPGCGLGRLVWECAARGFHATGNEFSYQMLMCAFLILNCCKATNIFTIYPWVHEAKNLLDPADQLRSVTIPDVDPTSLPAQGQLGMAAGDWMDIFSDLPSEYIHDAYKRKGEKERRRAKKLAEMQRKWMAERKKREAAAAGGATGSDAASAVPAAATPIDEEEEEFIPDAVRGAKGNDNANTWDVFASCYFVDCATNILEFLRTIAYVLKPGGHWINFGPLLYHFSEVPGNISLDLSWSELRRAIPYFGLELVRESFNHPSGYTSDERSMLRQQYFCVSCTWKKVGEDVTTKPLAVRPTIAEPKSVAWTSRSESNGEWTTVAIDADATELTQLLTVSLARSVGPATTPSGAPVSVWRVPAAKLGAFLLRATDDDAVRAGKIVLDGVEMLAVLKKKEEKSAQ